MNDFPKVINWTHEALVETPIGSHLQLRDPDRLLNGPLFRHAFNRQIGRNRTLSLPVKLQSHFAQLRNRLKSEPYTTAEAASEPLRIDGLTSGALPPPTITSARVRRHFLVGTGGIDIIANGGRGVPLDLSIDQVGAIQHPRIARTIRGNDV